MKGSSSQTNTAMHSMANGELISMFKTVLLCGNFRTMLQLFVPSRNISKAGLGIQILVQRGVGPVLLKVYQML
eukprot:3690986-Ditylum_brightwellii.AAC.1